MKKLIYIALFMIILSGCNNSEVESDTTSVENEVVETQAESSYPDYNYEELSNNSELVVEAKFLNFDEPFKVKPATSGDELIFEDGNFEIINSYKGNVTSGDNIKVRFLSNDIVDSEGVTTTFTSSEDVNFENNKTYLLFLRSPYPDGYKTVDNYYQTVTGPFGIYEKEEDKFVNDNKEITASDLESIDKSIDPNVLEREQMEENLQNGQITQEEFDIWEESLNQYGTKVE